jgi:hypothetical protein
MSKSSDARVKLDRLGEALAKDLDKLSGNELSEEIAADDDDGEKTVARMRNLIESAIAESGRRRLARARQAYDAIERKQRAKVIQLPLDRKKALVAHFAHSASALPERLTLAARNEDNSEADLDSLLEDLLELGVIDDEGNPR